MINKHILILAPGFPRDENDFNCIPPLQELLPKFKLTYPNSRISVIAFQYPYWRRKYSWNGLDIIPLGGKNSRIKKAFVWLRAIRQAKNINRSNRIDVIHSLWLGECAMIGNILSKKFECEHMCTLMGQDVKLENRYLKKLIDKKITIIALSKNQSEQFLTLTNRKVDEIIPWGIDNQSENIPERDIDLLGVGSLIPLKNYSLFIKAIEEIEKTKPDVKCILVGTGPESSKLKAIAKDKGLENNIDFQLTFGYNMNKTEQNKRGAAYQVMANTSNWSFKPQVTYTFTSTVRGGSYLEIGERKDVRLGKTKITAFGINANISLSGR